MTSNPTLAKIETLGYKAGRNSLKNVTVEKLCRNQAASLTKKVCSVRADAAWKKGYDAGLATTN